MEQTGNIYNNDFNSNEVIDPNRYSLVDEKMYYRSTINTIPTRISNITASNIPFAVNVIIENFENEDVPISEDEIVRCDNCRSYLNPFCEIVPPGRMWKCSVCLHPNPVTIPFQVTNRKPLNSNGKFDFKTNAIHNFNHFSRTELRSTVYDLIAPPTYSIKTPSPVIYCFLIESTYDSIKYGVLNTVLNSIQAGLNSEFFDTRARIMIGFFDSNVHLLKNDGSLTSIIDATFIPYFIDEDYLLPMNHEIDYASLISFFSSSKSTKNNYGDTLRIAQTILSKTGGCIMSFIASYPNIGVGAISSTADDLKCKSNFYVEMATLFSKQSISVSQFIFPHVGIELPTLNTLTKYTGGILYYYPNFDGFDPVFSTKLSNDLSAHFDLNLGIDGACRVRVSKNVYLKEYAGNFTQRTADLLSFPAFYPPHTLSFELIPHDITGCTGICVQAALIRTNRFGQRKIRVINFFIEESASSLYDFVDPYAIVHSIAIKSFACELRKRGSGLEYVNKTMKNIISSYKELHTGGTGLPPTLELLPRLMLALSKSIPLRPVKNTPSDYKSFYIYLITNSYPSLADTIIYPTLIALHNLDAVQSLPLSLNCLEMKGFYLLDTGVNIFFFVGRDCDPALPNMLFSPTLESDRFIFEPEENEFSNVVCDLIASLRRNRYLTPNYILVRDDGNSSIYRDIFFTYFVEDESNGLPEYSKYLNSLNE